jgi:hypothetical protein
MFCPPPPTPYIPCTRQLPRFLPSWDTGSPICQFFWCRPLEKLARGWLSVFFPARHLGTANSTSPHNLGHPTVVGRGYGTICESARFPSWLFWILGRGLRRALIRCTLGSGKSGKGLGFWSGGHKGAMGDKGE